MIKELLLSANIEVWITLWVMFICFMFMWYKGKLPSTGELQDLTTILNSRGGNILILAGASILFFYRGEHMYFRVIGLINSGKIASDNGIALNGLTFDTGAFGSAFGALLKTMSPDAPSPALSTSTSTTSSTVSTTTPPDTSKSAPVAPAESDPTNPQSPPTNARNVNVTQGTDIRQPQFVVKLSPKP